MITVVQRSTTEKNGPFHERQPEHGLKDGWFSRLRPVQAILWTPETAESLDLLLDEMTYSYIFQVYDL